MGTLAELDTTRGLPRGRGRLPRDEVAKAHRDRLLRAMTAAVAELGYANVRIADVVDRARVSHASRSTSSSPTRKHASWPPTSAGPS